MSLNITFSVNQWDRDSHVAPAPKMLAYVASFGARKYPAHLENTPLSNNLASMRAKKSDKQLSRVIPLGCLSNRWSVYAVTLS